MAKLSEDSSNTLDLTPELEILIYNALASFKPTGKRRHSRMQKALRYVNSHLSNPITLQDIWQVFENLFNVEQLESLYAANKRAPLVKTHHAKYDNDSEYEKTALARTRSRPMEDRSTVRGNEKETTVTKVDGRGRKKSNDTPMKQIRVKAVPRDEESAPSYGSEGESEDNDEKRRKGTRTVARSNDVDEQTRKHITVRKFTTQRASSRPSAAAAADRKMLRQSKKEKVKRPRR